MAHYRSKTPKPSDVRAWFAEHAHHMRVVYGDDPELELLVGNNETYYVAPDGTGLVCEVEYDEGCPTCGGGYVKSWHYYRSPKAPLPF